MRSTTGWTRARTAGRILTLTATIATVPFASGVSAATSKPSPSALAQNSCPTHVIDGVLPSWARDGFSAKQPRMPYELGARGDIAAILWADPLLSPPAITHNNKILWVSRISDNGSPLLISAQRMRGSRSLSGAVRRTVIGGPGPSIINLPSPGCWRVSLSWSGHHDTLYLAYLTNE